MALVAACLGCQSESGKPGSEDPAPGPQSAREEPEGPRPSDKGWVRMRPRNGPPESGLLQEEIDRLQALGYVSGSEVPREGLMGGEASEGTRRGGRGWRGVIVLAGGVRLRIGMRDMGSST